jgi:hypothetical protein
MRLRIRIERLVLDGLSLGSSDGPRVQAALEAELARRLGERGVDPRLIQAGATQVLNGGDIPRLSAAPAEAGNQIAQAVAAGMQGGSINEGRGARCS